MLESLNASVFLRLADPHQHCFVQYYLKPFHAYDTGNLSWDAALELELAAKSLHANVFDPEASETTKFLNDVVCAFIIFLEVVLTFLWSSLMAEKSDGSEW